MSICSKCKALLPKNEFRACPMCGNSISERSSEFVAARTMGWHSPATVFPPVPKTYWRPRDRELNWIKGEITPEGLWQVNRGSSGSGLVVQGPGIALDVGLYNVEFQLSMAEQGLSSDLHFSTVKVTAFGGNLMLKILPISVGDVSQKIDSESKCSGIRLSLFLDRFVDNVEFRIESNGKAAFLIHGIKLIPLLGRFWFPDELSKLGEKGEAWELSSSDRSITFLAPSEDYMLFGPYEYLSPGTYEVTYKLIPPEGLSAGNIARLDVVAYRTPEETDKHQTVVKGHIVTVEELTKDCKNSEYGLSFRSEQLLYGVEFRVKPLAERLKVKWIRLATDNEAIWQHYYQLGGINSALGPPRGGYWCAAGSPQGTSGSLRRFEGGSIYWNDNKGMAFDVTGAIGEYWESMGGSTSLLGFPTSRPSRGISPPNVNVTTQNFEKSRHAVIISYLDQEGTEVAYEVYGAIGGRYFQEGGPGGKFGLPTSGEEAWEWEGRQYRKSLFQGGTILWNKETNQTEAYLNPIPDISIEIKTIKPQINEPLHIRITAVNSGGEAAEGYFSVTFLDPVEIEGNAWRKITGNIKHIQYIKQGQEWWGISGKKYPFHNPMVEAVLQPVKAAAVSIFDVFVIPLESGPFRIQYKFSMKQLFDLGWVADPAYDSDTDIGQQGEHAYVYSIKVEKNESNGREQPKTPVIGVSNEGLNSHLRDDGNGSDAALKGIVRTRLHTVLDATFNIPELTELAFKLGLDYENLPSKTKNELIVSLIAYLERRERIDDLVEYLKRERPNAYMMLVHEQEYSSKSDD